MAPAASVVRARVASAPLGGSAPAGLGHARLTRPCAHLIARSRTLLGYPDAMSTVFTRIITGEIPGRFVWSDSECVAFLTIGPLTSGHTLVVPRTEVDHWLELTPELRGHLFEVAAHIGQAQRAAFSPERIGLMIQGFEVPHTHVHVWPTNDLADFDFSRVDHDPDPADLDRAGERLRAALLAAGHGEHVPPDMSRA